MKQGLRTQITLTIMLVALFTVALTSVLSNIMLNRSFEKYIAKQQNKKTQDIVTSLIQPHEGTAHVWDEGYLHTIGMNALYDGYIIKVMSADGRMIWDAENHDMSLCTEVMAEIAERMRLRYPRIEGEFVSRDYDLNHDGRKIGSVSIRYYGPYFLNENDFQFLSALNAVLLITGATSLAFSLIIGWLLARRIARPITKTADVAKQISEGNYAVRFESGTRARELNELVSSINHLAASLSEQERLRKQLTADVAHELRTPLAAVGSHLEAMIEGVWTPTPERLQSCHEEVERLGTLVTDLEQLAKVESENFRLSLSPTDLMELARSAGDHMERALADKGLHLTIEGQPAHVIADKDRISQVIMNLLSNAIKCTPEGGHIQIVVSSAGHAGVIEVNDDGIGVSEQALPHLFERFYRADKSRSRQTGGAGIGLAIVKSIVEAHGGTVEAHSVQNQGSRFIVSLPLSRGD